VPAGRLHVTKENGITPSVVSLVIPAKAEYIALGRLAVTGLLRPLAVEPEVIADVKLALTEACSNSIRHAYAGGGEGAVEIRYEFFEAGLAVEVSDEGGGFDPSLLEADPRELDEGGLGIAIIRAVTDDLSVGPRSGGNGSCLRFTKSLAS
jgi:serine/threonine-protein kinase RsbW